jgi:hypothetical protein
MASLRQIVGELIERRFKTQTALAEFLNPMPEGISPVVPADIQRLARAGRNQEKQWAIFVKLLPLCRELRLPEVKKSSVADIIEQAGKLASPLQPQEKVNFVMGVAERVGVYVRPRVLPSNVEDIGATLPKAARHPKKGAARSGKKGKDKASET